MMVCLFYTKQPHTHTPVQELMLRVCDIYATSCTRFSLCRVWRLEQDQLQSHVGSWFNQEQNPSAPTLDMTNLLVGVAQCFTGHSADPENWWHACWITPKIVAEKKKNLIQRWHKTAEQQHEVHKLVLRTFFPPKINSLWDFDFLMFVLHVIQN